MYGTSLWRILSLRGLTESLFCKTNGDREPCCVFEYAILHLPTYYYSSEYVQYFGMEWPRKHSSIQLVKVAITVVFINDKYQSNTGCYLEL